MTPLNGFYHNQKEPIAGCLIALRDLILAYDKEVSERWYYRLPCFFYKGKIFCYVWIEKKSGPPYIAFYPGAHLSHPLLDKAKRTRSKILRISPTEDIPLEVIYEIIDEALTSSKGS